MPNKVRQLVLARIVSRYHSCFAHELTCTLDHLLSYFLDADSSGRLRSNSDLSSTTSPRQPMHPNAVSQQNLGAAPPTRTPAVHFYAGGSQKPPTPPQPQHSPHQHQGAAAAAHPDSSLSSMASMAAALIGGPIPVFPPPSDNAKEEDTTISPTVDLIRGGHENLMLPPAQGQPTEAEKQQHLAWLQQINAMAAMARHQPNINGMPMPTAPGMPAAPGYPPLPPHAHAMYAPVPAAETEEKRARRLARNRESARQSRRRKKERLATLEKQVTTLFAKVEEQRGEKIMVMESELQNRRIEGLATVQSKQELQQLLHDTGPNCVVRERVASFQYEKLRQLLLPRHQEFLLWLTLQQDEFFSTAKNNKTATSSVNNKAGRVSSKQIGEELMNEAKKSQKQNIEEEDDKVSSEANDFERMWPLLCFELLVSVDQEERLVQTQRRYVNG